MDNAAQKAFDAKHVGLAVTHVGRTYAATHFPCALIVFTRLLATIRNFHLKQRCRQLGVCICLHLFLRICVVSPMPSSSCAPPPSVIWIHGNIQLVPHHVWEGMARWEIRMVWSNGVGTRAFPQEDDVCKR